MHRRYLTAALFAAALTFWGTPVAALDYHRHSDEQLRQVRDGGLFLDESDRSDFVREWQRRYGSHPWAAPQTAQPETAAAQIRPVSWSVAIGLGHRSGDHRHYRFGHRHHGHFRDYHEYPGYRWRSNFYGPYRNFYGEHRSPPYRHRYHGHRSQGYGHPRYYRHNGRLYNHRTPHGRGFSRHHE